MPVLGRPQGLFDLHDSDRSVGSWIRKQDVMEIFRGVNADDLKLVNFRIRDGLEEVDESALRKAWYDGIITNAPPARVGNSQLSLDELILWRLIEIAYPTAEIKPQFIWGRRRIDFHIILSSKNVFVEFHGPGHFASTNYNQAPTDPRQRREEIEKEFGVECIIWPYWIQRCVTNVRALFDGTVKGSGALWSTNFHFGSFVFIDSAQLIEEITSQFRADRDGYGYFYGPNTEGRVNPEHPVIELILKQKRPLSTLLPRGYIDAAKWLPPRLLHLLP